MWTAREEQNLETSHLDITGVAQLLSDEMKRSANQNSHEIYKPRDVLQGWADGMWGPIFLSSEIPKV